MVSPYTPARPMTHHEREHLRKPPPEIGRVLLHLAETRLLEGDGPPLAQLWSLYRFGDLTHTPRAGRSVTVRQPGGRTWTRSERDDCDALLGTLYPYGVRWKRNEPGTIHLVGPVYLWLKPIAVHKLTHEGRWPPAKRYSRRRSLRKEPVQ